MDTLFYQDKSDQGYVSIRATAQRINDQKEKDKRWKEGWKDFYSNRKDGYVRWLLAIGCSKCLGLIYN